MRSSRLPPRSNGWSMRSTVSTRFWLSPPDPMPGLELMLDVFSERVGLGRAAAISRIAPADSTARRAAISSRLRSASSRSAATSDKSLACANADRRQKINATSL